MPYMFGMFESLISIHALHEESDSTDSNLLLLYQISIHALHEESDTRRACREWRDNQFQSTLSMRRATWPTVIEAVRHSKFQSTLSMRRATRRQGFER